MNSKRTLIGGVTAAALWGGLTGCSTDECEQNKNTLPLAGFYSSEETPQSISVDSIAIYGEGAPNDSVLLATYTGVSEVYMPFRLDGNETIYAIKYLHKRLNGLTDYIKFVYEAQPYFVSAACGVSYKFRIKDIETTHVLIDSVSVPDNIIDNTNLQNIRIYFRVNPK